MRCALGVAEVLVTGRGLDGVEPRVTGRCEALEKAGAPSARECWIWSGGEGRGGRTS